MDASAMSRRRRRFILEHKRSQAMRRRLAARSTDNAPHNPFLQRRIFTTYWDLGDTEHMCTCCKASFWCREVGRHQKAGSQRPYSLCCRKGRVKLPLARHAPQLLAHLLSPESGPLGRHYRENIRFYNALFAFSSIGANIDKSVQNSRGPYVYKICGQIYHRIGSLLPKEGKQPRYAQLYVYESSDEATMRITALPDDSERRHVDKCLVQQLQDMLDTENWLAQAFRMAKGRFKEGTYKDMALKIVSTRHKDGNQYKRPSCSDKAALVSANSDHMERSHDLVVECKSRKLQHLTHTTPSLMALQYPLLFPYGEDGFITEMKYEDVPSSEHINRNKITMCEYYCYQLHHRVLEGDTLFRSGRLFQQYIVDAYTCIEHQRLMYIKYNQDNVHSEVLKGITDVIDRGDTDGSAVDKKVILPSSFTGGPRYMFQKYQDALALCRHFGMPHLFITFTCNTQWPEILRALLPGQRPEDRPDIVCRVFKMKVDELLHDLTSGAFFGPSVADIYTIEFQKRGLPHVHIVLWLDRKGIPLRAEEIDTIVSAELPNPKFELEEHYLVTEFMMHGPCGLADPSCSCMIDNRCSKYFPKKFRDNTEFDANGKVEYKRRDNGLCIEKNGVLLDNRHVVSYNIDLLIKFHAHINIEVCSNLAMIKYILKYVDKSSDRAEVVISRVQPESPTEYVDIGQNNIEHDEVNEYLDGRYLSPYECIWRILQFDIHGSNPTVQRLCVHLPIENTFIYSEGRILEDVVSDENKEKSMLTAWFELNKVDEHARGLTYAQIPTQFVWQPYNKVWTARKMGNRIGRISYMHPSTGEQYYLRLMLNITKGATSFDQIRTISGVIYPTFEAACEASGLLGDDKEWDSALSEAAGWCSSAQLRLLFVVILLFCDVHNPLNLYLTHELSFAHDIYHKLQLGCGLQQEEIRIIEAKAGVLREIQKILGRNGASLEKFGLPTVSMGHPNPIDNKLIREEMLYNRADLQYEHDSMKASLTQEQQLIYDAVVASVHGNEGRLIFVYGHGGTGKTYMWHTIISRIRLEDAIVLAVASSGIASLLLPGGRTAHSMFKIPIELHANSTCKIKLGTELSELLQLASLIVWDEAPMNHKYCFEALDRTLKEIMKPIGHSLSERPFGGKTVLLGGDFRQTLPVVVDGGKEEAISSCILRSKLWKEFIVYRLTINMRLRKCSEGQCEATEDFANWLLAIGDGAVLTKQLQGELDEPSWVEIPTDLIVEYENDPVQAMANDIYVDMAANLGNKDYFMQRAIVTPTNEYVDSINQHVLSMVPLPPKTYLSTDSICWGTEEANINSVYPNELLNSLKFNAVPNHELRLKIGCPIMMLRNINPPEGLCNGTRLIVTRLENQIIEAEIITGTNIGRRVHISRIIFHITDKKLPFVLKRRQFPVRLCFAMTINKSQGQTLDRVGVFLPRPVFSHGQLYVAFSRVTSRSGLRVLIEREKQSEKNHTKNTVYREIFDDIS